MWRCSSNLEIFTTYLVILIRLIKNIDNPVKMEEYNAKEGTVTLCLCLKATLFGRQCDNALKWLKKIQFEPIYFWKYLLKKNLNIKEKNMITRIYLGIIHHRKNRSNLIEVRGKCMIVLWYVKYEILKYIKNSNYENFTVT